MDLLELSKALISADTVSHRGTEAAVRVLRPLYEEAGLSVKVQEVVQDGVRQQNLLGTHAGDDARGLLLVTHLDTVDPGPPELWTETGANPHRLTEKGDLLYGLGTADTKLDAACKLFAARTFKGKRLRRTLQLLGTYEEEVGAKGAKHFIASDDFTARFVACSEPSELTIIRAHKGYAVVVVSARLAERGPSVPGPFEQVLYEGKAAHSSTPHLGVNAIEKALADIGTGPLVRLEGGTVSNKVPARCTVVRPGAGTPRADVRGGDAQALVALARKLFSAWRELALAQKPKEHGDFNPSTCVVNFGVARIDGDTGTMELTFDCRLLPGHDPDALTQAFIARALALGEQAGAEVSVRVDRASPAMALEEPSNLLDAARAACRQVGLDDSTHAKPTNTEAGVFARAGAEAIVFGPGRSIGNAHCANEHNIKSQLDKAILFYQALITRLCG